MFSLFLNLVGATVGAWTPIPQRAPIGAWNPQRAPAPLGRRALLPLAAAAAAAAVLPARASDTNKYVTLDQYNKRNAQEKADGELYGLFETLKSRAQQTGEVCLHTLLRS